MIIHPPDAEPNSQLQVRLCLGAVKASLVPEFHFNRYFPLELKVLSQASEQIRPEGRRSALVYGILSAPCMI